VQLHALLSGEREQSVDLPDLGLPMRIAHVVVLTLTLVASVSAQRSPALLLYGGGTSHRTFYGCLNCSKYDSESVCNQYGDFGSRYSDLSIWNRYGDVGSKYSSNSPWNKFASTPPAIVDKDGNFYGYFTSVRSHPRRTTIQTYLAFLDNPDAVTRDLWIARGIFCGD
jgi:hypothetical protein